MHRSCLRRARILRTCRSATAAYRALAERAEPVLFTRAEAEWLPLLRTEVDNLRAALDWSAVHAPVEALRLAGALTTFWNLGTATVRA